MAQVYAAPPAGGLFNIPDTLPQGLLYRYKKISNLSRQNLKMPPDNGQGDVWAGQKIIKFSKFMLEQNGVKPYSGLCQTNI